MKFDDCVLNLLNCFEDSFINSEGEFIVDHPHNLFIQISGKDELEIKASLLEWCSRDAANHANGQYRNKLIVGLNEFLGTDLQERDMGRIYNRLGNRVNHDLTIQFIKSHYDLDVLMQVGEHRAIELLEVE